MGLLGAGAMVFWYDVTDPAEHDAWHSHEHLPERLSVPGFIRGRRGVAVSGTPGYFVMYEVEDLATLASGPYLDRVNHPTPWSQRIMPSFRNMNRTLCRVTATFGSGVGTHLLTIRLAPVTDSAEALGDWLAADALPGLVRQPGIVGAHFLEGDEAASRVETEEKRLRESADETAGRVVLVDGYDAGAVRAVSEGVLSEASLIAHGARNGAASVTYHLIHIVSDRDAPAVSEAYHRER